MHKVTLTWAGGEHEFGLDLGGLRAVQDQTDSGPQEVLQRLLAGTWRVDDPLVILRQGLIRTGCDKQMADRLVNNAAESHGLRALVMPAFQVLGAALAGVRDDPVGEAQGEAPPPEDGASAPSTEPEPLPVSPRAKSTA